MMNQFANAKMLSIEPLINHFCERMSEEQWMLLRSGTPDAASKIQMAELVLGMIKALTTNVLAAMEIMKLHKSEEEVVDSLNELIVQISHQTLSFSDKVDGVQSKCLTTLITKEVTESICCSLSAGPRSSSSFLDLKHRIINPYRLNAMVTHASNMFKNMKIRMKALFLRRRLVRLSGSQDSTETQEKDVIQDESCQQKSVQSRTMSPVDSTVSKKSESLHTEIRNVASGIVTSLTDDLPKEEFQNLLSEITQEAQSLSEDIGAVLGTKTSNRLCKNIKLKIKNFFTKCIAKVWRCRTVEQLKDQYKSQATSGELLESLVENISSQVQMCVHKDEGRAEQNGKNIYFNVAIDDVNTFTEELYCMINHYFKPDMTRVEAEWLSVATRRNLCSDLHNKVWIFVALMNWWLTTQVSNISEQVNLTDKEDVPGTKTDHVEGGGREAGSAHIPHKTLTYYLIDNILWRIYKKTHLYPENRYHIHNRLFDLVNSNTNQEDLTVDVQMLNKISERIYKDLCRQWGSVHNIVALLSLDNPVVDMDFVSIFKYQLTRPAKKANFFLSLWNCIPKICMKG